MQQDAQNVCLHVLAFLQMSLDKATDYCRRRTLKIQQQQQGLQKVGDGVDAATQAFATSRIF